MEKIEELGDNPLPPKSIKLQGHSAALYRIRSGGYRVIYSIKNKSLTVLVLEIGHRRDIYR